jgi:ParB/RepB/Spo0J family partition protein
MNRNLEDIPLNKICSESSSGSPREFIENGIDDLKENIRSLGLVQPIVVYYNSSTDCYEVLSGYRRLNAYVALNEDNANEGYDAIPSIVVDEPETGDRKKAISLAVQINQLPMTNTDLTKAVTDLYNTYHDYDIVQKQFGLTKYMIKKFLRLSRLPERLVQAINEGEISPNIKAAENAAIDAVDLLNWQKDGDVQVEDVLKIAKKLAQEKYQAKYHGHLRDDGGIIGDGYSFGGCNFAVIVVGDDKGIFKNGKKMTREEFEKLPDEFRNSLRLQPHWK